MISVALSLSLTFVIQAKTFGGYDCTEDCSGHAAGYDWARRKGIDDPSDCTTRRGSSSFEEGCRVYLEDPRRRADEDDNGESIDR